MKMRQIVIPIFGMILSDATMTLGKGEMAQEHSA